MKSICSQLLKRIRIQNGKAETAIKAFTHFTSKLYIISLKDHRSVRALKNVLCQDCRQQNTAAVRLCLQLWHVENDGIDVPRLTGTKSSSSQDLANSFYITMTDELQTLLMSNNIWFIIGHKEDRRVAGVSVFFSPILS